MRVFRTQKWPISLPRDVVFLLHCISAKGGHRGRDHDHDRYHKKHDDDKKCPPLYTSPDLSMTCSSSGEGCSKITCSSQLDGQTVTLSLEFNSAEGEVSATITLKVPNLDYEWSHTFKSGDKIQVPGFPLKIKGVANPDMYLMLTVYKGRMGVAFKVIYQCELSEMQSLHEVNLYIYILLDSFLCVSGFACTWNQCKQIKIILSFQNEVLWD